MNKKNELNPNHKEVRNLLRIVGPCVLALGGLFMLVGMISFFSAFGSFGPPRYFWCCFVGVPLLFIGLVTTSMGYMGAVNRYAAGETAPVAKDTFNYLAGGTKDGVRDIASAITAGVRGVDTIGESFECPNCQGRNDPGAKFCDQCGSELATSKTCEACSTPNDFDARFCDSCGETL